MTDEADLTDEELEQRIRDYFDACNSGDPERIASYFVEDGVHYFPPGMYKGPFQGAEEIGERWQEFVEDVGSIWTVEELLTDAASARAVIEWTHYKGDDGPVLRGDEWYEFDPETGLIEEIRAYYAAPQDPDLERNELEGFDYEGRGYSTEPPFTREKE